MPLQSIPPVERGLVKGCGGYRRGPAARTRVATPLSTRRELSQPKITFPSIADVKVTRTEKGITWEFSYGEFEVAVQSGEVHVEVRIGGFSDAMLIKIR